MPPSPYTNKVHIRTVHNSHKVETTQMSPEGQINKMGISIWWNIIHKKECSTGILLGHKKEWSTVTYHNIEGPWRQHVQWKKPQMKGYILYDFIYMQYPEQEKTTVTENIHHCQGWRKGKLGLTANRYKQFSFFGFLVFFFFMCSDGNVLKWDGAMFTQHCTYTKNYSNVCFYRV